MSYQRWAKEKSSYAKYLGDSTFRRTSTFMIIFFYSWMNLIKWQKHLNNVYYQLDYSSKSSFEFTWDMRAILITSEVNSTKINQIIDKCMVWQNPGVAAD